MNAMSNAERQRLYRQRRKGMAPAPRAVTQRETGGVTGLAAEWTGRDEWDRKALGDFLDMVRLWERAKPEARDAMLQVIGPKIEPGPPTAPAGAVDPLAPGPHSTSAFSPDEKLEALNATHYPISLNIGRLQNELARRKTPKGKQETEAYMTSAYRRIEALKELEREYRQVVGVSADYVVRSQREDDEDDAAPQPSA